MLSTQSHTISTRSRVVTGTLVLLGLAAVAPFQLSARPADPIVYARAMPLVSQTGSGAAASPFTSHLHTFTETFARHDDALDELPHDVLTVGHRGGRGFPKSGNIASELLNRLSLCTAQHVRLRLQKALVIFLELSLGGEFLFPLFGQLPRH